MSQINAESFPDPQSPDTLCWIAAIKAWRDDQGKKNPVTKSSQGFQGPLLQDCDDLLNSAKDERRKFKDKSSGFGRSYHNIVLELQKYCKSINVMIQHQPSISALVWGGILLIISTSIEYHEAPGEAIAGIEFVIVHVGRWREKVDMWGDNERVCKSMTNLYIHVLRFIAVAQTTLRKRRLVRTATAFLLDGRERLRKSLQELQTAAETLEKEAGTARDRYVKLFSDDLPRNMQISNQENHLRLSLVSKLDKLKLPQPPIKQAAIGTCQWLFSEPLYQQFIASNPTSPLAIYGPAGHGKSTLAEVLRQNLASQNNQLVLTYFFGLSESGDEEALISFVSSLLSQMLSTDSASSIQIATANELSAVQDALNNSRHNLLFLFRSLWAALETILSRPQRVFLLVDGLDEYRGRTPQTRLSMLATLLNDISSKTSGRVIIFAREDSRLNKAWPRSQAIIMDARTTEGDVNTILEAAFESGNQAEGDSSKLPRNIFHDVQKRVHKESHGSMLWLEMYLDHLRSSTTNRDLLRRVSSFPSNLTEVYSKMNRVVRKTLTPNELRCRYALLQMAVVSRRPLTLREVTSLHDFRPHETDVTVNRLAKPFLVVKGDYVEFQHSSAREFMLSQKRPELIFGLTGFLIRNGSLHQDLAEKTLTVLLDRAFADLDKIKQLILQNTEEFPGDDSQWRQFHREEPAYDYCAKYWYVHVSEVGQPSEKLKQLVLKFLGSSQFVHWAEYIAVEDGENNRLARARGKLQEWARGRVPFNVKHYAIVPFQETSSLFECHAKDVLLKWLTLKELGNYLFLVNDTDLTWKLRNEVADGLKALLGPTDPLALRALSDAAFGCFAHDDMRTALNDFQFLYETQRKISGPDETATLMALAYRGHAEYYLGDSDKAVVSLSSAVESFRRKFGNRNINTLGFLWNIAIIKEARGENKEALGIFRSILEARAQPETLDETDLFAVMISLSIGNICRRRYQRDETFSQLNKAYHIRLGIWDKAHWLVVDAALARAIAYWQFGMHTEGLAQLKDIELNGSLPSRCQRVCQWTHLKALLSISGNDTREAIRILQELAIQTDRQQVNRAFLWSMLDLAILLRRKGLKRDAASLFDNLVAKPDHDPGDDDPDPPLYLEIAEKALRFTRKAQTREAQELLRAENLTWVREQDLWFWLGGPRADTEFMREP